MLQSGRQVPPIRHTASTPDSGHTVRCSGHVSVTATAPSRPSDVRVVPSIGRPRCRPRAGFNSGTLATHVRWPGARGAVQTCDHCVVNEEPGNDFDEQPTGDPVSGEIEYDCSPWAQETRQVLRSLLIDNEIPHAWEGTVLVVPAAFEEQVDELVDGARSTARSSLGRARATVAYEVSSWSAAAQNSLIDDLVGARIPYEWDSEGDLVVHEEDAEAVEEFIEALGEPDGGDELDGIALHDRLNELFIMVDRLCRDGGDRKGRKGVARVYVELENAAVPFGVEPVVWLRLHRATAGLLDAIGGRASDPGGAGADVLDGGDDARDGNGDGAEDDLDPDEPAGVESRAAALRDLLRYFV